MKHPQSPVEIVHKEQAFKNNVMHILFWLSQFARAVKPQKSHIGNESFVTNFSPVQVEILKDHRLNPRGDMHFYEDLPCYLLLIVVYYFDKINDFE